MILFMYLLTLLFIGLKLTNFIAWSWFFVLAPGVLAFVLTCVIVYLIWRTV